MNYATSGSHPLHIPGINYTPIVHTITMVNLSLEKISNSFHATVRMPGKARQVIFLFLRMEIVQQ
jgi:hypothetical protein